ncbi:hypothetical protein M0805_003815 [Coniferiporia weirii]|nr:hypothetical protein M0805_003815 [Coniferiporia weirii]
MSVSASAQGHKHSASSSQNHRAQLANAYNELGKELSSSKVKVVGNYTLGKVIGEGTYGKVRLGTHRLTSVRVAIKQIPKGMSAALTREIHHHRRLHHPHVTKLYEVIATESSIWLVTELCSGGELFDYLAEKGRLPEDESRTIFGQLCLAVGYIHEKGVVHRDLKLENVLLDERCRIKLGDFGFTREYERGSLLDTYCGTTGYAAPEMLLAKKYLGPEVDVWSLGIILYCLLTGTLPFDDDDESRMREKIILGSFDIPDWLSADARDLLRNILQYEPPKRLTIPQILAHPWFTHSAKNASTTSIASFPAKPTFSHASIPTTPANVPSNSAQHLPSPSTSESSFHSASSQMSHLEHAASEVASPADDISFHSNTSESTIKQRKDKKIELADPSSRRKHTKRRAPTKPETVTEEDVFLSGHPVPGSRDSSPSQRPVDLPSSSSAQSAPPTSFPTRTPARTKRRSVSSNLSQPSSPVSESHHMQLPPQDFASLYSTPAPLLFSTPLERSLLNTLSNLGFDIGQMVHSVLSDACDASGAMWWMLKRKAEKKALETAFKSTKVADSGDAETELETELENGLGSSPAYPESPAVEQAIRSIDQSRSAPELTFVPPTPTMPVTQRKNASPPVTPPRSKSPRSFLSPTPTSIESIRSSPSTPSQSGKDGRDGSKGRSSGKARSGSVSIVQRATTAALEAAGLVRKKSNEAVRDEKDKERERKEEKDKRVSSSSDSRSGHNGPPARLTKSPPLRPVKDVPALPTTPVHEGTAATNLVSASPWVLPVARSSTFSVAPTPANSPGNQFGHNDSTGKLSGSLRNRNSILATFRMWFNEDRKGKRKAPVPPPISGVSGSGSAAIPASPARTRNTFKRRGGWNGQKPHVKRASMSSRRSSSVNSRRSSVASMQMPMGLEATHQGMDNISRQKSDPSRRSFTPNSEFERDIHSSRPSSVRSYSMHNLHRKSPSTGSNGSAARFGRAASPLQKYHRRAGSSSSTRVVRQTRPSHSQGIPTRPSHVRSNSTASSIHSLQSSRPGSFYDVSEGEGQRTGSPHPIFQTYRPLDETPRRGGYSTVLIAHKKQTTFSGPSASSFTTSVSRSGWKKAWGTEPPGWRSRQSQFPVEVLAISSGVDQPTMIRDVFSGRQSINLGDDSDWIDEDEDFPAFAGGLGQIPTNASSSKQVHDSPLTLSPAPRGSNRNAKKSGKGRTGARSRAGHSPVKGSMPLPGNDGVFDGPSEVDPRMSRRQLPAGRSGPAFRSVAIQEEEEEEE